MADKSSKGDKPKNDEMDNVDIVANNVNDANGDNNASDPNEPNDGSDPSDSSNSSNASDDSAGDNTANARSIKDENEFLKAQVKLCMAIMKYNLEGNFRVQHWDEISQITGLSLATAKQRFGAGKIKFEAQTAGPPPPPAQPKSRQRGGKSGGNRGGLQTGSNRRPSQPRPAPNKAKETEQDPDLATLARLGPARIVSGRPAPRSAPSAPRNPRDTRSARPTQAKKDNETDGHNPSAAHTSSQAPSPTKPQRGKKRAASEEKDGGEPSPKKPKPKAAKTQQHEERVRQTRALTRSRQQEIALDPFNTAGDPTRQEDAGARQEARRLSHAALYPQSARREFLPGLTWTMPNGEPVPKGVGETEEEGQRELEQDDDF